MKNNFILPNVFLNNWNDDEDLLIKNLISDEIIDKEVLKEKHIIFRMFANHNAFDIDKLYNQFLYLSAIAKSIIDENVINNDGILLTGQESLFIKYFYFLISILNNSYEFDINGKQYHAQNVEAISNRSKEKLYILLSINYILFDLFDVLFTERIFNGLNTYVANNTEFLGKTQFTNKIIVPENLELTQDFRFIDFHFHNIVNNTFLKFIKIEDKLAKNKAFKLTSLASCKFTDPRFNISTINLLVLYPNLCLSVIHLGPGRGELRPIFNMIQENKINKYILTNIMECDHVIFANEIYLDDGHQVKYKSYYLDKKQIDFINESLVYWLK